MIRHQRRTISAENDRIVANVTSQIKNVTTSPTLNEEHQDIVLTVNRKNYWVEDLGTDIKNSTITIPLSEYVTRLFLTNNYYNKDDIHDLIDDFGKKVCVLESKDDLPQEGDEEYANSAYIFFIPHTHMEGSNEDTDIHDEYIWDSSTNQYERIGNTDVDLSPYLTRADFNTWITDTYTPFVTQTTADIAELYSVKADITYVDSKIIEDEKDLLDAIINEFNDAIVSISNENISSFMELIEDLSDSIDDSIEEHNTDPVSHEDIRDLIDESIDELDLKEDMDLNEVLQLITERINQT